jgi:hypothetical protein
VPRDRRHDGAERGLTSLRSGYNARPPYGRMIRWVNDNQAFYETVRSTSCDAAGRFVVDGLPDGEWFIEAIVTWEVPYVNFRGGPQGGTLMQRVKVEGGKTQKVVLTQ